MNFHIRYDEEIISWITYQTDWNKWD